MNERLQTLLKQLRLSGLAQSLDVRLQEAAGHQLNHAEFLELILQDELLVRNERQIDRRVKAAGFRELKTLDDFDFSFNPSIKKKQILRPGHLPLHPREPRRASARAAGSGQELPGPGDRLPGDQAGLPGAVPLDLRRGARLPARRGRRRTREGAGQVSQAGPADRRRHGHEAIAEAVAANISSRSSCGGTRPAAR